MKAIRVRFPVLASAALVVLSGTAWAEDTGQTWAGAMRDQERTIAVRLRFDNDLPVVRLAGPGYDCQFKTRRSATPGSEAVSYPIADPSGGRCDTLLGGRLEVATPTPDKMMLRAFGNKGEKRFEAALRPNR